MNHKSSNQAIPVYLNKRSFIEEQYLVGKFGKYESLPNDNSELIKESDSDSKSNYLIKVGKNIFTGHLQQASKQRMKVLIQSINGKIFLSLVPRELIFTRKVLEDNEETLQKTILMMKNKKIQKKESSNQIVESNSDEGIIIRFAG